MDFNRTNDVDLNLTFREKISGDPVDITGQTILFTLKSDPQMDDTEAEIQKVLSPSDITDPTNGKATMSLTHDETTIDAGDYWYDFKVVSGSMKGSSTKAGTLSVLQNVTDRIS